MAKGPQYERDICRMLSLWWTNGEDDDVYWRSEGSGGRAKSRGRKGKTTYGAHGDLRVTNPIGTPLIELVTIEIKRGYSKFTLQDVIDGVNRKGQTNWDLWYEQTRESYKQSGSNFWMIIHRRDKREALVTLPLKFWKSLLEKECFQGELTVFMQTFCKFQIGKGEKVKGKVKRKMVRATLVTILLDEFLEEVTPKIIKQIRKELR